MRVILGSPLLLVALILSSGVAHAQCPALSKDAALPFEVGLEPQPTYLSPDTISLTFDDGPDPVNTPKILDILKREQIRATFFINTETDQAPVARNAAARTALRRIVWEGHELGNHTAHHKHLPTLSVDKIEEEITGVEDLVAALLGPNAPPMTLIRAPYGEPYWFEPGDLTIPKVTSVIQAHGVHIAWAIDPKDFKCPDADCVVNHIRAELDQGHYGVVLLHSVFPQTVEALPRIIAEIRRRNMHFVTVEDVVEARYGCSSAELMDKMPER